MSTQLYIGTKGSGFYTLPKSIQAGQNIVIETWGGGSGGSGRIAGPPNAFGAAGAGGAYASSNYIVTPSDIANGIFFTVGAGSSGTSGVNSLSGGLTQWSNNNVNLIPTSITNGAVIGAPGTFPSGWFASIGATANSSIVNHGFITNVGSFLDFRVSGNTGATTQLQIFAQSSSGAITVGSNYTASFYAAQIAGSQSNLTSVQLNCDAYTAVGAYISTPISPTITLTGGLTRFSGTAAAPATTGLMEVKINLQCTVNTLVDITVRLAAVQLEQAAAATPWRSTPGFTLAAGGQPTANITGALGGQATASNGTIATFNGGGGAAFNAAGSGGGGSAGKAGAGNAGTIAGVGGQGDNTTGGTGGAVKATSPGNPGTNNNEGGGGGGGLKTVAGTGGLAGAPGGGGGGAAVAAGTGGAGANGQIRITYTPAIPWSDPEAFKLFTM